MKTATRVATVLLLIMVANCVATSEPEAGLPRYVDVPERHMLLQKDLDVWFSGQTVYLDYDGSFFYVEGIPYPYRETVTRTDGYLDSLYADVPRYHHLEVVEGMTRMEAHLKIEEEIKSALLKAHDIFDRHLGLYGLDPDARMERALELTEAQRTDAVLAAGDSLSMSSLFTGIGQITHHGNQTEAVVHITGLGTENMMFNTQRGPQPEPQVTLKKANRLASWIERNLASSSPVVVILHGGQRRCVSGPGAETIIREKKGR